MVYVLNINNSPLMPCSEAKARKLLKGHKAEIAKRSPFTIRLLFECENQVQDVTLGVKAGSRHVGLSAATQAKELYAADVELRDDIVNLISTRRELRRSRRGRKTRYRKARFNNRRKPEGWLAPSTRQKIQSHLQVVENVHKILPVNKIIVEAAAFDIQKIKNPMVNGKEYQQGEQLGFWNVREYILSRDGHTCQCCKGKSKDKILNVHHIESRKTGGDAPNNLVTLCKTCHDRYHKGEISLPKTIRRGMPFKDAAFMTTMRWSFYGELNKKYPDVSMTYGYITKHTRITHSLPKNPYTDARCITGNPGAAPLGYYFYQKKVRCHNRQIHRQKFQKGGVRKRNQAPYTVNGFRLFDKVEYGGIECFIFARRLSGGFSIRKLDGEVIRQSASYRKLRLLETRKPFLTERRVQEEEAAVV